MSWEKIAIISDIHSNLEALESVLKKIDEEKPDKIICLGDIVGYGADPDLCCQLVRRYCDITLLGNHDAAVAGIISDDYFVEHAREAIKWTKKVMKEENIEWLKSLPLTHQEDVFFFSHGAPYSPDDFIYLVTYDSAFWSLKFLESSGFKASFSGHAHITYVFGIRKQSNDNKNSRHQIFVSAPNQININDFEVISINVGSVGQPRDGNPKAAFGILEKNGLYRAIRTDYDIEKASKKILDADLPKILSSRLFLGK
jgi:predicted phosphodiesterase